MALNLASYTKGLNHLGSNMKVLNPRSLGGGGQIDPPPSIFLALNFCS